MALNCGRCTKPKGKENEAHSGMERKTDLLWENKMCSQRDRWKSRGMVPLEIQGKEGLKEEVESDKVKSFTEIKQDKTLDSATGRQWWVTSSQPVRGVMGVKGGPGWEEEWVGVERKRR